MDEQTQVDSSVEERLANYLSPEAATEPEAAGEEPAEQAPQEAATDEPQEQAQSEPEGETFEIDGEEYIVPPALKNKLSEWKEGALRRDDYTQKTQALAELTRQVTAFNEQQQAQRAFDEQVASERQQLEQVKHQLKAFKGLDWAEMTESQYRSLRHQMEQLKDQAGELETTIKSKETQFHQWVDSKKREAIESGQKYLAQTIKGWSQEGVKEVASAAKSVGFTDEEIGSVMDPRFVHIAWKAAQFDKLQASKPAAVAAAKKAPPVLKPGPSQGQQASKDAAYKDMRSRLGKSGSVDDAARLLANFR